MFRKNSRKDSNGSNNFPEIETQDQRSAIEQMLASNSKIFTDQGAGTITVRTSRQIVERQETSGFTEIETRKTTTLKNADEKNEQKNTTISRIFSKLNLSKTSTTDSKDKNNTTKTTKTTTTTKALKSSKSFKTEETITSSIQEQRTLNMANLLSTPDSSFNLATNFIPTVNENTSTNTNATLEEHIDAIPVFVANSFNPLNSTPIFNKATILTPQPNTPSCSTSSSTTNLPPQFVATTIPLTPSGSNNSNNEFLRQNSSTTASGKPKSNLKPGLMYIFNHEQFDDDKTEFRTGSSVDVKSLCETFEGFKLKVEVHTDATLKKIRSIVKSIETKDFTSRSCLVVVILSHGHRYEKVSAKNTHYNIDDDILFPILRNQTLTNKPKIFFIQACKGSMEVGGFQKDAQPPHGAPAEVLKCYSTFEGYVSYRTENGSFFVQKLCENIKRDGYIKSIDEIMKDVTSAIKTITNEKQIPTITSTLTEPFIFGDYV